MCLQATAKYSAYFWYQGLQDRIVKQINNKFSYYIQEEPSSNQVSQNLRMQPLKSIFKDQMRFASPLMVTSR